MPDPQPPIPDVPVAKVVPVPQWAEPGHRVDETAGASRVLIVGRVMAIGLTVILVALVARVAQLQTHTPPQIADRLDSQKSTAVLAARRGTLLDRHGRMIAVTRTARRLFVDPALIRDRNTFSEHVGYSLNLDPVAVEMAVSRRSRSRYVVIDQRMDEDRAARFDEVRRNIPGLATENIIVRDYPYGTLAGQLIGFVGADGDGLEGLERLFNDRLRGEPGRFRYLRDASGRPLWVEAATYQPNTDGQTIRMSLDITIQAIAEMHLAETVQKYRAESGQMIVMDPHTGEILAMANFPAFDPTAFGRQDADLRRNRAVTDTFEPGSTFKPFIWAAATQLGYARPEEMFDCTTSGVWRSSQGRRLRDARPQGLQSWEGVLIRSSNIGMAIVGERIGERQLHAMVRAFGFGQPTGSGLPGEVGGIVNPLPRWTHYSVTSVPMGQEIGVTGLQMVRAFAVLANGGFLVTPTIEPVGQDFEGTRIRERVLSEPIAAKTREVLGRVVTEGTGRRANSRLYAIFGKTGTAQLPDFERGGYHQDQYIASFVAGAPLDQPRLVIGCFIHRPDRAIGHFGGTVAAPPVMKVLEESLLYLGVHPDALRATTTVADGVIHD
jgi:cell division protein FtsI (penicillin-binding protein 3)